MKFVFMALISAITLSSFSAQAFITPEENSRLLTKLNDGSFEQVHFEEIRCSLRSRMCLVKMEVGPRALKAGCMIEQIGESSEVIKESVDAQGNTQTDLSSYAQEAVENCIAGLTR